MIDVTPDRLNYLPIGALVCVHTSHARSRIKAMNKNYR